MAKINPEMIKKLREITGAGILDCKKALMEANGDMEKAKEIAILKSMGASCSSIMKIYSYQGLVIGLVGTFLGCATGFVIVPNLNEIVGSIESIFGIVAFPSDVYYLDRIPSKIQYMDSFLIVIFSVVICLVASLYPAWRASKLDLVDGLRYE